MQFCKLMETRLTLPVCILKANSIHTPRTSVVLGLCTVRPLPEQLGEQAFAHCLSGTAVLGGPLEMKMT